MIVLAHLSMTNAVRTLGFALATGVMVVLATSPYALGQGDVRMIDPAVIPMLDPHYTWAMLLYGHSCVPPPNSGMVSMFC